MNKVREYFPMAAVNKNKNSAALLNFLELPAEVKSWILMKFSDEKGRIDAYGISEYVKNYRLKSDEWNIKLLEARHSKKGTITLLTKVKIEFDYANDIICFSLPEYGFPKKAKEAQTDWSVVSEHKKELLTPDAAWGEITLMYDCGLVNMISFKPLCPYTFDLNEYRACRKNFEVQEWIDILLGSLNFNPAGFDSLEQKLTLLQRFLPFVEKRLNTIELATKGTGKSYCYSQLSPDTWCVSGGTVTRATAFYDMTRKQVGYFGKYSQVIFDEVQTIKFPNPEEIGGALKSYLESGEIRCGAFEGMSDAGLTLVGNIPVASMDTESGDMFKTLPKIFHESALVDRFHGIIEGWKIPRMNEDLKMEGWTLSTDYIVNMFDQLRDEFYYRAIIDELVVPVGKADTRNLEAVKRLATGFLKLLFPSVTKADDILPEDFKKYCLDPALKMRGAVLSQLKKLDVEYQDKEMPTIMVGGQE